MDARVLRGGSFNNNARNVRAANRNRNDPDNRNDNIGLRVCASHIFPARQECGAAIAAPPRCERWRGWHPGRGPREMVVKAMHVARRGARG